MLDGNAKQLATVVLTILAVSEGPPSVERVAEEMARIANTEIQEVLPKPTTACDGVAMPRKTQPTTRPR